jgi:hypothetical protein
MKGEHMKANLGDKICFDNHLKRVWIDDPNGLNGQKRWKKVPHEIRHGIIIGQRTLSNGINNYDSEGVFIYDPEEYFKVWLVAYDMNRNPVYVSKLENDCKD